MNREQKAATIEALAEEINTSEAVFAVDYRGISVPQAAELRTKLRDADATFRVVKNSLTERAADQVGAETLKPLLSGPTALTFVRGDAALAAKAIADLARTTQLVPFKGGLMNGDVLDADQIRAISRLPSREVLYGQLVGIVAAPISGLVRTLNALVGGLAVALGQVQEKKASGEIPAGEPPAAAEPQAEESAAEPPAAEEPATEETSAEAAPAEESAAEEPQAEGPTAAEPAAETPAETEPSEDAPAEETSAEASAEAPPAEEVVEETAAEGAPAGEAPAEEPAAEEPVADEQPEAEAVPAEETSTEEAQAEETSTTDQTEPASEPAQDDNNTDASAQDQPESAEATKED
jgi:large subunit ribosomal protein L10